MISVNANEKDWHTRKIARDGVVYVYYNDGSNRLVLRRDRGSKDAYGGVNERLYAMRKKSGGDVLLARPVGVDRKATLLLFEQAPGFWRRGSRENYFRVIHSDLERSHAPQDWATGFMPIIGAGRFKLWTRTQGREVLEFEIPTDPEDLRAIARGYIILLLRGWNDIETVGMLRSILNNVGIGVGGKIIRSILDDLEEEGFVSVRHRAYSATGMWPYNPHVRRYSWTRRAEPGAFSAEVSFEDRLAWHLDFLGKVAAPFEKYAKVSVLSEA